MNNRRHNTYPHHITKTGYFFDAEVEICIPNDLPFLKNMLLIFVFFKRLKASRTCAKNLTLIQTTPPRNCFLIWFTRLALGDHIHRNDYSLHFILYGQPTLRWILLFMVVCCCAWVSMAWESQGQQGNHHDKYDAEFSRLNTNATKNISCITYFTL